MGVGLLAGPLAGGALIGALGWRGGFLPQVAVALLALALLLPGQTPGGQEARQAGGVEDASALATRRVLAGLLAAFLCFVAMAANRYLMPLFLQDALGYGPAEAGLLLDTVPGTIIVMAPAAGQCRP